VNGTGKRTLISKPKIFGFGLNFQHCAHVTYFPTHSYEQYYQAVRRCWRFGQTKPVQVDLIDTDSGERVLDNLMRKSKAADEMFSEMIKHMNDALSISAINPNGKDVTIPSWLLNKS
jgi:SNF2 family DNA or RNA helicase